MQEVWLPVVGYEGLYEISDWGRIRGLDRLIRHRMGGETRWAGRLMQPSTTRDGYLRVTLSKHGSARVDKIHILVAAAFIGPRPDGMEVCHGEGGKLDNRPENLRYGTAKENQADRLRDGTHNRGERHGNARLTKAQVRHIRRELVNAPRGTAARLARELGVSPTTICEVRRETRWAWLEP
jgi:hypothetical protein